MPKSSLDKIKRQTLKEQPSTDSHTGLSLHLVLTCVDFRFQEAVHEFLIKQGLKDRYDLVCLAGASKNIVDPLESSDFETMLHELELCCSLHKIENFWIIDHEDCGAYGGSKAFKNKEEERKIHEDNLKLAKDIVLERYPHLEVRTFYAELGRPISG